MTTTASSGSRVLTLLAWTSLLICIGAWATYAVAPEWSAAARTTGLIAGGVFLLFFVVQLVGD